MKRIKDFIFVAVFLLIVIALSSLSCIKWLAFYINREQDNNEWTPELGSKLETDIASAFFNKSWFVNFNGAVANALNQPSVNGVVKLNNGYLLTPMDYCPDKILQAYANSTIKLNEYLKNRGTLLLYVSPPYTSSKYDPQLPIGIEDYGNSNIDRFLSMLQAGGVDTVDFRQTMYDDGIDEYAMMYKTDHHWTTEAGLYAYGILENYITEKTGCEVDERIANIENYTVTTYEKWHLGSRGQRTGMYYAGIDDFDLIIPDFESTLRNKDGTVGSMEELMINMEPLANKDYTSRYTYDHVLDAALGCYTNLECRNDIKVLTITDSFGKATNPYLAMGFSQLWYVHDLNVAVVTREFIEENDPDVVIMMYYPERLCLGSEAFSFDDF